MRKAELLSTTTHPRSAARCPKRRLVSAPALKKKAPRSSSSKTNLPRGGFLPFYLECSRSVIHRTGFLPAERADAKSRKGRRWEAAPVMQQLEELLTDCAGRTDDVPLLDMPWEKTDDRHPLNCTLPGSSALTPSLHVLIASLGEQKLFHFRDGAISARSLFLGVGGHLTCVEGSEGDTAWSPCGGR